MQRYLSRYLMSRSNDLWLLLHAYICIGLISVALRAYGFQRTIQRIEAPVRLMQGAISRQDVRRARRYARWIDRAARHHVVQARCLHRSLVLHQWLRREGLPSELQIGVSKAGDALKAHAWVELGGYIVNDQRAAIAGFIPLSDRERQDPERNGDASDSRTAPSAHIGSGWSR